MIILKVKTLAEKLCYSHRHILLCALKRHQGKKKGEGGGRKTKRLFDSNVQGIQCKPGTPHRALRHNEAVPQSYTS